MSAHTSDLTLCLKTFYLRSRCFTGNVPKGLCRKVTRGRFSVVREHTALLLHFYVILCHLIDSHPLKNMSLNVMYEETNVKRIASCCLL